MTKGKKFLKFLAILLALTLSVGIISAAFSAIASAALVVEIADNVGDMTSREVGTDYDSLDISLGGAALIIKNGESFAVDSNIPALSVKSSNGKLTIKQRDFLGGIIDKKGAARVVVTIPEGTVFNDVSITSKAGKVDVEALTASRVDFEFGAGEVNIKKLTVTDGADIDGGVGKICIESGEINDLDLSMGVGELALTARLTGTNSLVMGVGRAVVKLVGDKNDYTIDLEKGVGPTKISGINEKTGVYGKGRTVIEIEGGVGSTSVSFVKGE